MGWITADRVDVHTAHSSTRARAHTHLLCLCEDHITVVVELRRKLLQFGGVIGDGDVCVHIPNPVVLGKVSLARRDAIPGRMSENARVESAVLGRRLRVQRKGLRVCAKASIPIMCKLRGLIQRLQQSWSCSVLEGQAEAAPDWSFFPRSRTPTAADAAPARDTIPPIKKTRMHAHVTKRPSSQNVPWLVCPWFAMARRATS